MVSPKVPSLVPQQKDVGFFLPSSDAFEYLFMLPADFHAGVC